MRESSVAAPMRNNKGESIGNERFPANQVAKSGFPARGRPEGEGLTAQPAGASAGGGFSTHRLVRFSPLPARPRGRDRPSLLSRSQIPRLFPAGGSGLRSRVPPPPPPALPGLETDQNWSISSSAGAAPRCPHRGSVVFPRPLSPGRFK